MADELEMPSMTMGPGMLAYAIELPSDVVGGRRVVQAYVMSDARGAVVLGNHATDAQLREFRDLLWEVTKRVEDSMEDRGMFTRRTPGRGENG